MSDRLILFTRYPEPGQTKTRLIPALGPEGAANLQRQMTEQTLATVRELQSEHPIEIDIYFSGGDRALMQTWLGEGLTYHAQGSGDLGNRMASAFTAAFESGASQVVIIGIDCLELTATHLQTAFHNLKEQDLVIGPAMDGGYYLLGLRRLIPALFEGIAWSTEQVYAQTLAIAQNLGLSVAHLPILRDIDRPEDLPVQFLRDRPHAS